MENPVKLTTVAKVQAVINTVEVLEGVPLTYDNVNKITGIYQMLFEIQGDIKDLEARLKAAEQAEKPDTMAKPETKPETKPEKTGGPKNE